MRDGNNDEAPRDVSDADVDALVAAFDEAVDQGRVRPVDGAVFRELRAAAAGRRTQPPPSTTDRQRITHPG
jgi:hypothetical protein